MMLAFYLIRFSIKYIDASACFTLFSIHTRFMPQPKIDEVNILILNPIMKNAFCVPFCDYKTIKYAPTHTHTHILTTSASYPTLLYMIVYTFLLTQEFKKQ